MRQAMENITPQCFTALFYQRPEASNSKLFQLLLNFGFLCKYEKDITQIEQHVHLYHPQLIYAPQLDSSASEWPFDNKVHLLITSKQGLYKELAKGMLELSERAWMELLRDVPSDDLYKFLWYVCDANVLKSALSHMSLRTAQETVEVLEKEYSKITHYSGRYSKEPSDKFLLEVEDACINVLDKCCEVSGTWGE